MSLDQNALTAILNNKQVSQDQHDSLDRKSVLITRLALILAIAIYFVYRPIDARMLNEWEFELAWTYRSLVFIPATVFAFAMTFRPSFRIYYRQYCLAGVMALGIAMATFAFQATSCAGCGVGGNVVIYSYPAIIMICVYSLFMLSMPFAYGLFGAWFSVAVYVAALIASYWVNPQPESAHYYVNASLQPTTICALLSYGAFRLDFSFRQAANNMQMLRSSEKQRVRWLEDHASIVSHELKNAWLGISTTLVRIRKTERSSDIESLLDRADVAVGDMKHLLQSVGDAVNEEAAFARAPKGTLDLGRLILGRLDQYRHIYSEVEFQHKQTGATPLVHANPDSLSQLLDKLVGNAVEHRDLDTPVQIHVRQRNRMAEVRVINSGSGLPDDPSMLFDLRVSLRKSEVRTDENKGFGLYIANRIAQEHLGSIEAQELSASGEGKQIVFTFTIPLDVSSNSHLSTARQTS